MFQQNFVKINSSESVFYDEMVANNCEYLTLFFATQGPVYSHNCPLEGTYKTSFSNFNFSSNF